MDTAAKLLPLIKKTLFIVLCYTPYYYLVVFHIVVIYVRNKIGYWPRYDKPDPGTLNIGNLITVLDVILNCSFFSALVIVVFYGLQRMQRSKQLSDLPRIHAILFWIGFTLIFVNAAFNPFFEWLVD